MLDNVTAQGVETGDKKNKKRERNRRDDIS